MRRIETTVEVAASPERVWAVLTEVALMPTWTESVTSVVVDPPGALAVGSRALVVQPKLSPATWVVTELRSPRSFIWETRAMGTDVRATHNITPTSDGATVTLGMDYDGPTSALVAGMTRRITEKYLRMEAEGLKRAAER